LIVANCKTREEGMSEKEWADVDALLHETFKVLAPSRGGSSDEVNRKAALRENIARYLAEQGKPLMGGGVGGPATFAARAIAAPGSASRGSISVSNVSGATFHIVEDGGVSFRVDSKD
jgi:hypothetical protein